MKVTLSASELCEAACIGCRRQAEAMKKGSQNAHGWKGKDDPFLEWERHIVGAWAEMCVAKGLGLKWSKSVNTYKSEPDVGDYHVRWRALPHWDLLIRQDDDPEGIFILVQGWPPQFDVRGWIKARDGQVNAYLKEYGYREPAYFVPQRALSDMQILQRRIGLLSEREDDGRRNQQEAA